MNQDSKKYLVAGLGKTGEALAEYFYRKGEAFYAFDELNSKKVEELKEKYPSYKDLFFYQRIPDFVWEDCKKVLLSPGIPLTQRCLQKAVQKKIPIHGELEFAASQISGKIIGVTGTNGKSTTVSLLYELLKKIGCRASLKGNIGDPFITALGEDPADYYVVELSSFQLESIESFSPHIAVILNVSPDHLDRYESLQDYLKAKANIFKNQGPDDYLIYNHDDLKIQKIVKQASSQLVPFSLVNQFENGAYVDQDSFVMSWKEKKWKVPLKSLSLYGLHHQENVLATLMSLFLMNLNQDSIPKYLSEFQGLPHRLEKVATYNDIVFFDDSKATNVGSVVMSLASFPGNIILFMGGQDKNSDFSVLKGLLDHKVKNLILFGEARFEIQKQLSGFQKISLCEKLSDAIELSFTLASPSDVVLLSPACASFDQYSSYKQRGEDFQKCVLEQIGKQKQLDRDK